MRRFSPSSRQAIDPSSLQNLQVAYYRGPAAFGQGKLSFPLKRSSIAVLSAAGDNDKAVHAIYSPVLIRKESVRALKRAESQKLFGSEWKMLSNSHGTLFPAAHGPLI